MASVKMEHVYVSPDGTASTVLWMVARKAALDMVNAKSMGKTCGNAAVTKAGMDETAVFLWSKAVRIRETMTRITLLIAKIPNVV